VTELARADTAGHAARTAEIAAEVAGVRLGDLRDLAELQQATALFGSVWPTAPGAAVCTMDVLRALSTAGNYVGGAYQGERLIGASAGFFEPPAAAGMHSHISAVAAEARSRNVGFAMKQHQRAWALRHGLNRVSWTYDPLVSRNAYFNLAKLGATATRYLPNFYGQLDDEVNAGDESDRLVVDWALASGLVVEAARGNAPAVQMDELRARGAVVGLSADERGAPVVGSTDGPVVLVGVPADVEALRKTDKEAARNWRYALRSVLGGLLDSGGRVTGFAKDGWYVVEKPG
jgi:predicted GNAT superfamily acetyltransferase